MRASMTFYVTYPFSENILDGLIGGPYILLSLPRESVWLEFSAVNLRRNVNKSALIFWERYQRKVFWFLLLCTFAFLFFYRIGKDLLKKEMSGNRDTIEEKENYISPEGEKSGQIERPLLWTACRCDLVSVKIFLFW